MNEIQGLSGQYLHEVSLSLSGDDFIVNDSVWFAVGKAHSGTRDTLTIRVELISPYARVCGFRIVQVISTPAPGFFPLSDTLADGPYLIRAFPVYADNSAGPGSQRYIQVSNPLPDLWDTRGFRKSMGTAAKELGLKNDNNLFLWTEAQLLLHNRPVRVAVLTVDRTGMPLSKTWKIAGTSQVITTDHRGWGAAELAIPEGKFLELISEDGSLAKCRLPDRNPGVGFSLAYRDGSLLISLLVSDEITNEKEYRLIGASAGDVFFNRVITIGKDSILSISEDNIPDSWFSILLLSSRGEIISERFVPQRVSAQEVTMEFADGGLIMKSVPPNALAQVEYLPAVTPRTIPSAWSTSVLPQTYATMQQALKDPIGLQETRYLGRKLAASGVQRPYVPVVEGRIVKDLFQVPVRGATVRLICLNDYFTNLEVKSDAQGRFSFDVSWLEDSATMVLEALNRKGRKSWLIQRNVTEYGYAGPDINMIAWYHDRIDDKPARGKWKPDSMHRIPGSVHRAADMVLYFDETEAGRYSSVFQMLEGRVPGLNFVGYGADRYPVLRGPGSIFGSSEPLYLIDDVPVHRNTINAINPLEVERIEIIKDAGKSAVYGLRGGNGVIAVYTRRGMRIAHGELRFYMVGYHDPGNFSALPSPLSPGTQLLYWGLPPTNGRIVTPTPGTLNGTYRVRIFTTGSLPMSEKEFSVQEAGM